MVLQIDGRKDSIRFVGLVRSKLRDRHCTPIQPVKDGSREGKRKWGDHGVNLVNEEIVGHTRSERVPGHKRGCPSCQWRGPTEIPAEEEGRLHSVSKGTRGTVGSRTREEYVWDGETHGMRTKRVTKTERVDVRLALHGRSEKSGHGGCSGASGKGSDGPFTNSML